MISIIIKVKNGDEISHEVVDNSFLFADLIERAMFQNFGMDTETEDMVDVYIPESDSRYKLIHIHGVTAETIDLS